MNKLFVRRGFFVLAGIFLVCLAMLHITRAAGSFDYYISPIGDDNNPGTFDQPFKTIEKARDTVRSLNSNMSVDINVYLRGGVYAPSSTLTFTQQDSGTNGFNINYKNYPGETPTISGGKSVTNWVQEGDKWKAQVGVGVQARQLYINGNRAIRARSPAGLAGAQVTASGYTTTDTSMQSWGNAQDVEFVINQYWRQFRCGVQSISGTTITMKQPCWDNINSQYPIAGNEKMYIENAYELLDTPGEWYLNRQSGWLYYMPRDGEDMTKAQVVLPSLETLVSATGTLDSPVHNLKFQGITFAYSGWTQPNDSNGFAEVQANWRIVGSAGFGGLWTKMPANINIQNSKSVRFERDVFAHLGAAGVSFGSESQNNVVIGNQFYDISGNGLMLGEVDNAQTTDQRLVPQNNQITSNYIHNVATEYQGGVGVWLGYTQNSLISHNELHQLPYTAISIGWGWGKDDPSIARDNLVQNNLIYDHVQALEDGGGIYSLSAQPGNIYSGNVIQEQYSEYGGIYLDNHSRYITLNDNVLFGNQRSALLKVSQSGNGDYYIHDNWWQNRFPNDEWYYYAPEDGAYSPSEPGPNTIANNHEITDMSQAPSSVLSNAGIESTYQDIRNSDPLPSSTPPASPTAPAAPVNLKAVCSPGGDNVTVSWSNMNHATSYLLRIDDTSNNSSQAVGSWFVSGTTDLQTEITVGAYAQKIIPGKAYSWWVHSNNKIGFSPASTGSFICNDSLAPSMPQNLKAVAASASQINLSWGASSDNLGVSGYKVFRNGVQIATTTANSYTNTGLTPATTYKYTVAAYDAAGNTSAQSAIVSATTQSLVPAAPGSLKAVCSPSRNQITVSWSPVSGAASYLLRIDDPSNNTSNKAVGGWYVAGSTDLQTEITGTSYTSKINSGKTYNWWVQSKNSYGTSSSTNSSLKC